MIPTEQRRSRGPRQRGGRSFSVRRGILRFLPRILKYVRPYKRLAAFSVLITAVAALITLLMPWPLKILIDNVIQNAPGPQIVVAVRNLVGGSRIMLLLAVVTGGFLITLTGGTLNVLSNYVNTKLQEFMVLDLRSELFQHAQRLSLAFHDKRHSGKLIYVVNEQSDAAASLVLTLPELAQSVLTLIGMLVISFRMDARLA